MKVSLSSRDANLRQKVFKLEHDTSVTNGKKTKKNIPPRDGALRVTDEWIHAFIRRQMWSVDSEECSRFHRNVHKGENSSVLKRDKSERL